MVSLMASICRGTGSTALPLYFLPDKNSYLESVRHEESLAQQGGFVDLVGQLPEGGVILSARRIHFYRQDAPGESTLCWGGRRTARTWSARGLPAPSGTCPGSPAVSISDRESFDAARIDYVNHLFSNNAYIVADPNLPSLKNLDVLITGVQFAIELVPGSDPQQVRANILDSLPVEPSGIRTYRRRARQSRK